MRLDYQELSTEAYNIFASNGILFNHESHLEKRLSENYNGFQNSNGSSGENHPWKFGCKRDWGHAKGLWKWCG